MRFSRLISSFFLLPSFRFPIYLFSKYSFLPLSATLPSMSSSLSTLVGLQDNSRPHVDGLIIDVGTRWRCEDRQT